MSSPVRTEGVDSLSLLARQLTRVVGVLFALLGLALYVAPGWAAANFPWKVSPFVAMTMGGWYLGMAYFAWEGARVWRWPAIFASMATLWLFCLLEAGVLIVHRGLVRLDATLGWPYVGVLAVAVVATLAGVYDWVRLRPQITPDGEPVSKWLRRGVIAFVIGVFVIAMFPILGYGQGGTIFPERLTLFTLNAFGVFYFALSAGALPLVRAQGVTPVLVTARAGLALIIPITLAALLNIDKFDFIAHPGQLIYLGVYVIVGIVIAILLLQHRTQVQSSRFKVQSST
jgi:hypothetical protein